jgi:hypothetical protein
MYADTPPKLITEPRLQSVLAELMKREPIFHHPEFGAMRKDFEAMLEPEFWEVGASGRRYSREYVLDELEKRHATPQTEQWETRDFHCMEIAPENYLLTYTLIGQGRVTRRATLWRRRGAAWKIVYHQGTVVQ